MDFDFFLQLLFVYLIFCAGVADPMVVDPSSLIIPAVQSIITLLKKATSLLNPLINDDDEVSKV